MVRVRNATRRGMLGVGNVTDVPDALDADEGSDARETSLGRGFASRVYTIAYAPCFGGSCDSV